ncbi:zinc finger, C3HC4 type (RING finger) protein (macronuclear) [Tetrahymena thermophila SB210]|uniref:Zinc finger, C3HC4 type (RING finger) protein n=1 Tax=Tetrahymena thermophila (strain SB210) TaxID=312017 RepID=Q22TJ5_TETTS|nr:zinc finger, C3HC4 type (RING finger) protein [Tetrahymena thermophila SB210]EAR88443.3 zinc finger, C3HC4 type (RING finger) protein [Tetrahymena thermophila SB210]|eukprot:XP_001008688.3 zinc finger, C3HC4 type (RING finger) protein [Tetrahymena thermophila SB210]
MSHFCIYMQSAPQNNDNIHITNLPQSSNDQSAQVEDTPQQKKMKQNILINKAILFLDAVKVLMFALALRYTEADINGDILNLFNWCKQMAILALLEGCLKTWVIRNETIQMEGLNKKKQQSLQLLDETLTAALTQPTTVESADFDEIEFLQLFTDSSVQKTKKYLKQIFFSIENILTILINLTHIILFILGNLVIYDKTQLNQTFIYKTASVYLLIGFLTFCIPIMILVAFLISIPILLFGYIFSIRNIINLSQQKDELKQNKLIKAENVTQDNILTTFYKKDCSICLSMYEVGDNVVFLPCNKNHNFHDECIQRWLKVNNSCPVCRQNVNDQGFELQSIQNNTWVGLESHLYL